MELFQLHIIIHHIKAPIFLQHIESSIIKDSNTVEFTELGGQGIKSIS